MAEQKQPVINYKITLLQDTNQGKSPIEIIFTEVATKNIWGAKTTVSGPSSTLQKTAQIRSNLPSILEALHITSILDCGCGDFHWMKTLSFPSIQYLGVDIVEKLIKRNQELYTSDSVHFQKMNLLEEPPERADLWLARDFCCLYSYKGIKRFFEKFLESNSPYIALTSVQSENENTDGMNGSWRPLSITAPPFNLQQPVASSPDDQQWFRNKVLNIYTREQIQNSLFLHMSFEEDEEPEYGSTDLVPVVSEHNSHLSNNIRLRDIKLPSFK